MKPGIEQLVARTGFEPVISALRGRRPEPLDERAVSIWRTATGWDGGSRTPIDGTRIRCPAIRRHPNWLLSALLCARKNITGVPASVQPFSFENLKDVYRIWKQQVNEVPNR